MTIRHLLRQKILCVSFALISAVILHSCAASNRAEPLTPTNNPTNAQDSPRSATPPPEAQPSAIKQISFTCARPIGTVVIDDGAMTYPAFGLVKCGASSVVTLKLLRGIRPELGCVNETFAAISRLDASDSLLADRDVPLLQKMQNLSFICLRGTDITDAGLAKLSKLPQLHELDISCTDVTGEGLSALPSLHTLTAYNMEKLQLESFAKALQKFTQLMCLDTKGVPVTGSVLDALTRAKLLYFLHLDCSLLKAGDLNKLAACKHLRELHLESLPFPVHEAESLKNLPELNLLSISNGNDLDARFISSIKSLRILDIANTNITGRGLCELSKLPHLTNLTCKVDEASIGALNQLTRLTSLSVANSRVTEKSLALLARRLPLKRIVLTKTNITDGGLRALSQCKSLEEVEISNTDVSSEGVLALLELPHLKKLSMRNTRCPASVGQTFRAKRPDCLVEV